MNVTDEDRNAVAAFFRDERTGLSVKFNLGANPQPILEAFAAHRERGYLRGVEDTAKVLDAAEVDECVRLRNVRQRLNTAASMGLAGSGNRPIIAPLNLSAP